jgi:hypothetical protein
MKIKKVEEAEIASSAEYLHIDSIYSLINLTNLNCARPGFQGAKDESPPQNDQKNRVERVTKSQAQPFI